MTESEAPNEDRESRTVTKREDLGSLGCREGFLNVAAPETLLLCVTSEEEHGLRVPGGLETMVAQAIEERLV